MQEFTRRLRLVLTPRAQRSLLLAGLGSVIVALLDAVAVALVLPLVSLVSGAPIDGAVLGVLSDLFGTTSRQSLLLVLTLVVVVLFVAKDIGSMLFSWWSIGFVLSERVHVTARVLDAMLRAPYTVVAARNSAEMLRTADTSVLHVFGYSINALLGLVSSAVSISAMVAALCVVAPLPTLILIVYFGVAALLYDRKVKPRAVRSGRVMSEASMRGYMAAFAAMGAAKELKLRGSRDHFVAQYENAQLEGARAGRTATFLNTLPKYVLEILFIIAIAILLAASTIAGESDAQGQVGLVALFVAAGFRMLPSVSILIGSAGSVRVGMDALRLVSDEVELLEAVTKDGEEAMDRIAVPFTDQIQLDAISFRYPDSETNVIDEVNLTIQKGDSIALVGGSGAGKSTLADLILGLHKPDSGRILVDGQDIWDGISSWRRRLSFVAQDVFILDGTIAENVIFDDQTTVATLSKAEWALDKAQLSGMLAALPDGLDTQVGERGAKLSGGQRQRIGIARALYRDCNVLVLDEATSALDNETEYEFNAVLNQLRGSITLVTIAHRLSTVRGVDDVIFLEDGRIRARGTFEELARSDSAFARLVRLASLDGL